MRRREITENIFTLRFRFHISYVRCGGDASLLLPQLVNFVVFSTSSRPPTTPPLYLPFLPSFHAHYCAPSAGQRIDVLEQVIGPTTYFLSLFPPLTHSHFLSLFSVSSSLFSLLERQLVVQIESSEAVAI